MTPQEHIQPVRVDMATVNAYISLLFGYADWSDGSIVSLLGIGEKGTPAEGRLRERKFIDPRSAFAGAAVQGHLERWGLHHGGAFIVPAMVRPEAEGEGDVRLDKVSTLTAIILDIDSGDTHAKRAYVEQHLGPATFIVDSGGVTAEGTPKQHLYWRLSEVEEDVEYVAALRKQLARKCGGDQSFGRATQVIRIPGSIHGKNGAQRMVTLHSVDDTRDYHLSDLADAIESMPVMPGCEVEESNVIQLPLLANGAMDFSGAAGRDGGALHTALTSTIAEGGDADRNRWTEFSRVAGFEISLVRQGRQTLEQAAEKVHGWVLGHMNPPWPPERIRTEWVALLNLDTKQHGPMPAALTVPVSTQSWEARLDSVDDLLSWAVINRTDSEPPEQRDLVQGILRAGNKNMLVAEGAAGKSFLMMDLALKLAAAGGNWPQQTWLGQPVSPDCEGGTVVLISAEDDADELHRRWHMLDPDYSRRRRAGTRLLALPLDSLGGSFPFVADDKSGALTEKWHRLLTRLIEHSQQPGVKIIAVIIDTLNATYHAEENSATAAGQYLRAITPICGALGAAAIVTHHIKKPAKEGIKSAEEMYEAVRGSSALPNGMRSVVGVWHSADYKRLLKTMGQQPVAKRLYHAAVLKANGAHMVGQRTLLRNQFGLLEDVTMAVESAKGNKVERAAWLLHAIDWYASHGVFFTISSRSTGLYKHRHRLPDVFHNVSVREIEGLAQELISSGRLIQRSVQGAGTTLLWLDVKSKAKTRRVRGEVGREPPEPVWDDFFYEPTTNKVIALAQPKGE